MYAFEAGKVRYLPDGEELEDDFDLPEVALDLKTAEKECRFAGPHHQHPPCTAANEQPMIVLRPDAVDFQRCVAAVERFSVAASPLW
jgi:hypothetical protein